MLKIYILIIRGVTPTLVEVAQLDIIEAVIVNVTCDPFHRVHRSQYNNAFLYTTVHDQV